MPKIIIDIPEEDYILATKEDFSAIYNGNHIVKAIENGIPIPDNATNGDVIKNLFADFMYVPWKEWLMIDLPWWNAPYQKGGKECR